MTTLADCPDAALLTANRRPSHRPPFSGQSILRADQLFGGKLEGFGVEGYEKVFCFQNICGPPPGSNGRPADYES